MDLARRVILLRASWGRTGPSWTSPTIIQPPRRSLAGRDQEMQDCAPQSPVVVSDCWSRAASYSEGSCVLLVDVVDNVESRLIGAGSSSCWHAVADLRPRAQGLVLTLTVGPGTGPHCWPRPSARHRLSKDKTTDRLNGMTDRQSAGRWAVAGQSPTTISISRTRTRQPEQGDCKETKRPRSRPSLSELSVQGRSSMDHGPVSGLMSGLNVGSQVGRWGEGPSAHPAH